jgi:hypothetical protein
MRKVLGLLIAGSIMVASSVSEANVARSNKNQSLQEILAEVANAHGLPVGLFRTTARIESTNNPNSKTRSGTYKGLFMLSNSEFKRHGGGNIYDPRDNANAFAGVIKERAAEFQQRFKRAPSGAELYLMHQQGVAGFEAHMANPDAPAWENVSRFHGDRKAKKAIWGNIPADEKKHLGSVDKVTSRDFVNLWTNRFAQQGREPTSETVRTAGQRQQGNDLLSSLTRSARVNLEGIHDAFKERLNSLIEAMPESLRSSVRVTSGFRDPENQASIVRRKLAEMGKPATPENMARGIPGRAAGVYVDASGKVTGSKSRHAQGSAVDIWGSPRALSWLHKNAPQFGVENPTKIRATDPVHFQAIGKLADSPPLPSRGFNKDQSRIPETNPATTLDGPSELTTVSNERAIPTFKQFMDGGGNTVPAATKPQQYAMPAVEDRPAQGGILPAQPDPSGPAPSGDRSVIAARRPEDEPIGARGSSPGGALPPGGAVDQTSDWARIFGQQSIGEIYNKSDQGGSLTKRMVLDGINNRPQGRVPLFRQIFGF